MNKNVVTPDYLFEVSWEVCNKIGGKLITVDASNGIDEIIGNPRNKIEREGESLFIIDVVRSLSR